jgi:menaquinone-specific isochorismate synthase
VPIEDPGHLLARLADHSPVAWVRGGEGLAGWGEAARLVIPAGEDRFTAGEKRLSELFDGAEVRDQVGVPGSGPVAFGSFTFDPTSDGSVLVVPAVVLGRRAGRSWMTTITAGATGLDAAGDGDRTAPAPGSRPAAGGRVRWHDGSLSAPEWEHAVDTAVARIRAGDLSKVVLARDLYATAPDEIDVRAVLARLAARHPDCWTFSCAGLVGATPELYIRREGAQVSSLVLGGTAPRGGTAAEDQALGSALLASAKNTQEHGYTAADVRAALAPLCRRLDVDDRPWLLRLASLQHLATNVTGLLSAPHPASGNGHGYPSALAVTAALHPTAAVCGTPAAVAIELIRDLEGMDRGRYAGPVGWIDAHGDGEWGIALRCAELDGRRARLFAGCGIVADSDPAAELAEAQVKFRPMQDALEG